MCSGSCDHWRDAGRLMQGVELGMEVGWQHQAGEEAVYWLSTVLAELLVKAGVGRM